MLFTFVIGELLLRTFHEGQYPLITLNLELLLVGSLMIFATVRFHVTCKRLFGQQFVDEKNYFKNALTIFVSTYLLRTVILLIIVLNFDFYSGLWDKNPLVMAYVQSLTHLAYDALPLLFVMR